MMRGGGIMKDRFTKGYLAGVIAGVPSLAFGLTAESLQWTNIRWAHFASILIYGRIHLNLPENIFATFAVFFFCGLMGTLFAFIMARISCRNYFFKSWVFSVTIWFFAFATTFLFQLPQLHFIPLHSAISNFGEATIWGLSLGYCLKRLDNVPTGPK